MLREALTWLLTPCTPTARKLGYLREAVAFASRARRCRSAWAPHFAACHRAVAASLAECEAGGTALVLGSGLAAEFPLEALSARFERVVLVDMVHLPEVRRRAGKLGNVELCTHDLSGVAAGLAGDWRDPAASLDGTGWTATLPAIEHINWALSCNLLSQLPLLPVARLRRLCPQIGDDELEAFGRRIMRRHLDAFLALPAERCLIADGEQLLYDAGGRLAEHSDYRSTLGLDSHIHAEWSWQLAPSGELADGYSAIHKMIAGRWPHPRRSMRPIPPAVPPAGCA